MNDPANSSDEELISALSDPDSQALAALVGRHVQPIYDFALRLTLDTEAAADVCLETFDHLREQAFQKPDDLSLRAWLLNFALERGLEALNADRPGASKLSTGDRRFTQTDAGIDREAALWAWQAARSLRPRDYAVLDLTARRGLDAEELKGSAAQGRGGAATILNRASEGFSEAYMATALYFRGRDACADLAELVGGSGAGMRVGIRRQIASHVEDCERCQSTLGALPSATEVLAALRDVELPLQLSDQVAAGVAAATAAASQLSFDEPPSQPEEAAEPEPEADEPEDVEVEDLEASEVSAAELEQDEEDLPIQEEPPAGASEEELWARPDGEPELAGVASTELPETIASMESRYDAEAVDQPYEQVEVYEQNGTEYTRDPYYGGYAPPALTLTERLSTWFAPAYDSAFTWSYAILGVVTAVAVYIGIALALSLSGGSESQAIAADEVREIDCAAGPLTMNADSTRQFEFDPDGLGGFELDRVTVAERPSAAPDDALQARVTGTLVITADAAAVSSGTARSDEYVLQILWVRDDEDAVTDCELIVNVAASAASPTPETDATPEAGETPEAEGTTTP